MLMRRALLLLTLALLAYNPLSWAGDGAYWIDVRTAEEYQQGHVEEAINIPYEEIVERIGEVTEDQDALIYVYCRSGRRSGIAQGMLLDAGYTQVINLGGLEEARKKAAAETTD
jgi:phage shock protein E